MALMSVARPGQADQTLPWVSRFEAEEDDREEIDNDGDWDKLDDPEEIDDLDDWDDDFDDDELDEDELEEPESDEPEAAW